MTNQTSGQTTGKGKGGKGKGGKDSKTGQRRAMLIAAVREHAKANLNSEGGWDYCDAYDDDELWTVIGDTYKAEDAIKAMREELSGDLGEPGASLPEPEPKTEPGPAATKPEPKTKPEPEPKPEPKMVPQLDYKGNTEYVDQNLHSTRFTCPICGGVRWVAPGDLFQVDACKPCVEQRRKAKRNERAKRRRQRNAAAKAAAKPQQD